MIVTNDCNEQNFFAKFVEIGKQLIYKINYQDLYDDNIKIPCTLNLSYFYYQLSWYNLLIRHYHLLLYV